MNYLQKNSSLAARHQQSFLNTDIYAITSSVHSRGRSNLCVVREVLEAGIQIVQYREKEKTLAEKYRECRELRTMTADFGARLVINDDVDLALMIGADGIHIGQDDWPVSAVRQLVGASMAIGLSTHSPAQAAAAVQAGVDYIGVGPLFPTSTKKDVCAPVGLNYLEHVVREITLPFVAIGGIKAHNIQEVVKRGARCICLVTEIVGADNIGEKIQELRNLIADGANK